MPLNSFAFLIFLPVVITGAWILRDRISRGTAQAWLLGASILFYSRSGVRDLPLLFGSIAFNWYVARSMAARQDQGARKRMFIAGLIANIAFLCVFKYANIVAAAAGAPSPNLGFPLGISFFTLTQIMYLVDCYERLIPANSFFDHATFVSFFPNVTAGPLTRAKRFVGQLPAIVSPENRDDKLGRGIVLLAIGLFKKVVIADSFARIADAGYANFSSLSTVETWMTALAYTFQMYFDFSGYSDMAYGAARMTGIELVRNFNAPYRAVNISDFWQRWHISLSSFITTYLYTPMLRAMGKVTLHKAALATLIAMTIAGIWHGAAWTYLAFYAMHGVGLAFYQYWKKSKRKLPAGLGMLLTFAYVNLAFIVFRAPTVGTALHVAGHLVPGANLAGLGVLGQFVSGTSLVLVMAPVCIGSFAAFAGPTSDEFAERFVPSWRIVFLTLALLGAAMVFMLAGSGAGFIYRMF